MRGKSIDVGMPTATEIAPTATEIAAFERQGMRVSRPGAA